MAEMSVAEYRKTIKRTHKMELEAIRKAARLYGGIAYVTHQSGRIRGSAGVPDLFILLVGDGYTVSLWWEVKTRGDRLRPAQEQFLSNVTAASGYAACGTFDDFLAYHSSGWMPSVAAELRAKYQKGRKP